MARIETAFSRLLGITYPIVGAPMFLVSYEDLVVAVSEAGGLGAFPLPNYRTLAALEAALGRIRSRTARPIAVDVHVSGRFPYREQLAICLDHGVRFFFTSLGDPALIVDTVHDSGGLVYTEVISRRQALRAKTKGVDGLVAIGAGAGGHTGDIPLPVLVPDILDATGLPLLAAGGISRGSQLAAALALGADGVLVGTRLVASVEAGVATAYKEAVVAARPEDIVSSTRLTGNSVNWLRASLERVDSAPELASKRWREIWSAGLSVAQADSILPAGEIVQAMAQDCLATLARFPAVPVQGRDEA